MGWICVPLILMLGWYGWKGWEELDGRAPAAVSRIGFAGQRDDGPAATLTVCILQRRLSRACGALAKPEPR